MFACIFVPNFPVAAVSRADPELRAQAVAIFEGKPPLEKVFAVNESAGRIGIVPGMTKAQAELCSELTLRPRSLLQESAAHAALLDCAQSFSPCVEDAAADIALVDLEGMESLFGSLPEIAHAISRRATSLGLEANVAVASNPDAAVLAARGFPGVTVIPPGKEGESLGSLPVEVLFADRIAGKEFEEKEKNAERLLATLERWGIRHLRALAALPEIALSERLGQEGLRLRQLARGTASRTLVPVEAPAIFEEAVELEYPSRAAGAAGLSAESTAGTDLRAPGFARPEHARIATHPGTRKFFVLQSTIRNQQSTIVRTIGNRQSEIGNLPAPISANSASSSSHARPKTFS